MTDSLLLAVHAFASRVLMSVLVVETLLTWYVNLSTSFRELPFSVEMSPIWLKHIYSVFCASTCLQRLRTKVKDSCLPYDLPIARGRIVWCIPFQRKCKQPCPGFELESPNSLSTTIKKEMIGRNYGTTELREQATDHRVTQVKALVMGQPVTGEWLC